MGLVYKDVSATAQRAVAICDVCAKELILSVDEADPSGWVTFFDGSETLEDGGRRYTCSWPCLRNVNWPLRTRDDRANVATGGR